MPNKPVKESFLKLSSAIASPDPSNFCPIFVYLLETTTDFLYFKDKKHRFIAASQAFAELTGHNYWQDLLGKHDLEIFPKHHAKKYYEAELQMMNEGKKLKNWREPYVTLKGETGWVSTNKWPIKDKDHKIIGLFGISRDVTELVRAEEKIQKSEENFRLLFEHSSMGIAIHEFVYNNYGKPEDYIIRNVNPAYSDILGIEAQSVLGQKGSQLYGSNPAPLLSKFASLLTTQQSAEFNFFHKPIEKWFKIIAYSHQPDHFITVFEDITKSKKDAEEREQMILELKNALAEVQTLSGLLPICASCKKIRDDKGYWNQIEFYIENHSKAYFSHSMCPECSNQLYGGEDWYIESKMKKK